MGQNAREYFEEMQSKVAINPDVCMTEAQRAYLEQLLLGCEQDRDEVLAEFLPLVNSFRLDCENCLRENCEMRDPDVPVEQVRARISRRLMAGPGPHEGLWTIYELDFSHETCDFLHAADLTTLDDICKASAEDILGLPDASRKHLEEIERILSECGLSLKSS